MWNVAAANLAARCSQPLSRFSSDASVPKNEFSNEIAAAGQRTSEHKRGGARVCRQRIFKARWRPVRVKKARQIKKPESSFDSVETGLQDPRGSLETDQPSDLSQLRDCKRDPLIAGTREIRTLKI